MSSALVSFPQTVRSSAYIITLHAVFPKTMSLVSLFYFALASGSVPVPVAARSKAWFFSPSLAGFACSNPAGACLSLVNVVCCQVEFLEWGYHSSEWILLNVVCLSETSIMKKSWPTRSCWAMDKMRTSGTANLISVQFDPQFPQSAFPLIHSFHSLSFHWSTVSTVCLSTDPQFPQSAFPLTHSFHSLPFHWSTVSTFCLSTDSQFPQSAFPLIHSRAAESSSVPVKKFLLAP